MKTTTDKQRNWMTAITFAEAGEWEIAREMMPATQTTKETDWLQKMFMAITFAEAGLHQDALHCLEGDHHHHRPGRNNFLDAVGLRGVRVTYGILSTEVARCGS